MSTTSSAANGTTKAKTQLQPERLAGMAVIREAEAWRTASVMHDAAYEGERLCEHIYRAVADAYKPSQGASAAAQTLADPAIRAKAEEARQCLYAAMSYLNDLVADTEPPF